MGLTEDYYQLFNKSHLYIFLIFVIDYMIKIRDLLLLYKY